MKKAFSLIEIMQTVVLLGIIAGLSISFFKKINSDQKLYIATEKQLTSTIREVERKMCNDMTPACSLRVNGVVTYVKFEDLNHQNLGIPTYTNAGAPTTINTEWNCTTIYNDAGVRLIDGYCKFRPTSAAAACPVKKADIPHTLVEGVLTPAPYDDMIKGDDGWCYAPPPCPMPDSSGSWTAKPISSYICKDGEPNHGTQIAYYYTTDAELVGYPAFCTYFHDAVAHKKQGVNDDADMEQTCGSSSTVFNRNTDWDDTMFIPTNIDNVLRACPTNDICPTRNNYNMLLPNGVYLYNLNNGPNDIIVKYDRDSTIGTASYDANNVKNTTIRVYSYTKAQYNNGNGEVTNANDLNVDMIRNTNAQDREKCPNGGLYFGTKEADGQTVNDCHILTETDTSKCKNGGRYVNNSCQDHPSAPQTTQNNGQGTTTTTTTTTTNSTQNDGPTTKPKN